MWDKEKISELQNRRAKALAGGGAERVAKQHSDGKMTARERLEFLFDDGKFTEINTLVQSKATDFGMDKKKLPGDGVVVGYGYIHGRLAFASSQDFTVNGGSLGQAHAEKICRAMDMAMEMKAPFISLNDSGGARIEEGIDALCGYGDIFYRNTMASGVIPQISVILGPCAGGACYSPAICDFIFMTEKNSYMFITGPAVVKTVTGEDITTDNLGSAAVHSEKSGVAHFVYPDEKECLNGVRRLLSYLPQNNSENPPTVRAQKRDGSSKLEELVPQNSKKNYDMHDVIDQIVDTGSLLEVQPNFAKNIITAFARFEGKPCGIIANQPSCLAGSLDCNSSDKAARFIRFCDCFNIPLLSLVDVPAYMPGSTQEHSGIIRHGAKLLYAFSEATVGKVCLIMRKAYGGAYIAMNSKTIGADVVYAWPIAEIAVMGAEGAVNIIGRKAIANAADKDAERAKLVKEYNDKFMTPYIAAEHGFVDEVILPEETREKIISAFTMLEKKEKKIPNKKHGNIPL